MAMTMMNTMAASPAAAPSVVSGASGKRASRGIARPSLVRGLQMRRTPSTDRSRGLLALKAAVDVGPAGASANVTSPDDPLLLRAARGEKVERTPVWMMRQAGRYMKIYQDLCKKPGSTTFRERSENVDLVVEISLQPWKAFGPDGVILFSDILTPLSGMNIPFDIVKAKGPVIHDPITTMEGVREVQRLVPEESVPYVGASLKQLRAEVGNKATVLGFVGAPFTLASYIVEGGTSYTFSKIKALAFNDPDVLHALLAKLTESVTDYCRYQADAGAQTIQIFDSWASYLSPQDFEVFCLPYLKSIVADVRATHPHVPLIVYASGSAGLMTRLAEAQPDILSLDMSVQMGEARGVLGPEMGVQGNMDPGVLFGTKDLIEARTLECIRAAGGHKHIMNLGHGVMVGTPEENVAHFFEVAKTANER